MYDVKTDSVLKRALNADSTKNHDLAKRLVETGILSGVLPQGEQLIRRKNDFYTSADVVGQQQVLENAKIYVDTTLQWKTLYDVKRNKGLKRALNADSKNRGDIRRKLTEHNILSGKIADYDDPELLLEEILTQKVQPYFDSDIVGHDAVLENRRTFLASKYFQEQLHIKGIELENIWDTRDGAHIAKTILGLQKGEQLEIPTVESDRQHKIVSEWSPPDEVYLSIFAHFFEDEDTLMNAIDDKVSADLGRSRFAVLLKMQAMGLFESYIEFSDRPNQKDISYRIPDSTMEMFTDLDVSMPNYAHTLAQGIMPEVVPIVGHTSACTDERGIPQFHIVTTPVFYRGANPALYTHAEQKVLKQISDFLYGETSDAEPFIVEARDNGHAYAQVVMRRRFSIAPETFETTAIQLEQGKEAYMFT